MIPLRERRSLWSRRPAGAAKDMAKRKENMLEAFQASVENDPGGREASFSPLAVGWPFVPAADVPKTRNPDRRGLGGDSSGDVDLALAPVAMPFGSVTFVLIQILLLAGSFALGRLTARTPTEAKTAIQEPRPRQAGLEDQTSSAPWIHESADPPDTPIETPATGATAAEAEVDQQTEFDRAFDDRENLYTIQVIEYDDAKSEWMGTLAYRAYDHLFDRGLHVVKPRAVGGHLIIYVGAARTKAELEDTLAVVRKTPGPDRRGGDAFASALIVKIPRP